MVFAIHLGNHLKNARTFNLRSLKIHKFTDKVKPQNFFRFSFVISLHVKRTMLKSSSNVLKSLFIIFRVFQIHEQNPS